MLEVAIPASNRRAAAFALGDELSSLKRGNGGSGLFKKTKDEFLRSVEYLDCGPAEFRTVVEALKQQLRNDIGSLVEEAGRDLDRRLRSIRFDDPQLKLGKPVMSGACSRKMPWDSEGSCPCL